MPDDCTRLELISLRSSRDPRFDAAWRLMESSFPSDQRRSLEQQHWTLRKSEYTFSAVMNGQSELAGIACHWQLEQFLFIEHLAVQPEQRGLGIGSAIVRHLCRQRGLYVLLETDPLDDGAGAQRKIGWYEHLGFVVNPFIYLQPAYSDGKDSPSMTIMSFPAALSRERFDNVVRVLRRMVYEVPLAACELHQ